MHVLWKPDCLLAVTTAATITITTTTMIITFIEQFVFAVSIEMHQIHSIRLFCMALCLCCAKSKHFNCLNNINYRINGQDLWMFERISLCLKCSSNNYICQLIKWHLISAWCPDANSLSYCQCVTTNGKTLQDISIHIDE